VFNICLDLGRGDLRYSVAPEIASKVLGYLLRLPKRFLLIQPINPLLSHQTLPDQSKRLAVILLQSPQVVC
jgi:hypothetical protein